MYLKFVAGFVRLVYIPETKCRATGFSPRVKYIPYQRINPLEINKLDNLKKNFKKANTIVEFLNRYGKNSIWKNSLFEEKSRTGKNSRIRGKNAIEICIKCGWFLERKNRKNGRHVHGGTFPAELAHNAAITRVQAGAKRRSKDVHVHQPRVLNPCVHTGARNRRQSNEPITVVRACTFKDPWRQVFQGI